MSPFELTGKVALVTGTSRGLGQQFARALADAGADLILTSRTLDSLDPFAEEMRGLGRRVACVELDVRDHGSIQHAIATALAEIGQIDILINNAGCNIRKRAVDVTWEDWQTIVDTNLRGSFFVAQAVARHMIERRARSVSAWSGARIVNIGSVTCVAGYSGLAPYGASRGGIKQMTMSLAHDWGEYGITVNCLAPGWFKTAQNRALYENEGWVDYLCERIPLGRPGTAGDLDGALLLLASDAGRYITGQTILVDGGISVGAVRALSKPATPTA
jgi:gluconate 5-dehydrogenase